MHAHKIRYDEEFIAPREERKGRLVEAFTAAPGADFKSPARDLQDQLKERIGEISGTPAADAPAIDGRLRGSASLAIIVGTSLILWAAIIAAAVAVF